MRVPRRLYLSVLLKLLIIVGLLGAAIPFIASLLQGTDVPQRENPWRVEIDLADMAPGQIKRLNWPGGEVWIYQRSPEEVKLLQFTSTDFLRDSESIASNQPLAMRNSLRSLHASYFVFLPRETRRGCRVHLIELDSGRPGFTEPCYNGRYDSAGRIFRDSGDPEQRNLPVPPYEFTADNRLRLSTPEK
jgi:ubiquinol-cytochrome c reductase iron-sulfur subunit